MKKRIAGVLVVFGLVVAAVLWPRADAEVWPLALRFAPGVAEHYRLVYTQDSETVAVTAAEGQPAILEGHVSLSGELSLTGTGKDRVLVRFESLAEHELTVAGQSLLADPATVREQLLSDTAQAHITPQGEVLGISFRDAAHPMFERIVQLVLSEAQLYLEPTDEAWARSERTLHGEVECAYRVEREAERAQVEKTRASYQRLQALTLYRDVTQDNHGEVTAVISRAGTLESLAGSESISASADGRTVLIVSSRILLEHVGTTEEKRALAAFEHTRALGEVGFSEEAERQSLRQRAEGLTREQMLADLKQFGFGAQMPDHNRWLWRATGLMRLEPEIADDLAVFFPSKKLRHEGRALVLDLLVGAQHYRAQETLVALLQSPAGRGDERYGMLFQRLNLLNHPSPATVAFVESEQRGEGMQHALATNALGSMAGSLVRAGEDARGLTIAERLLAELRAQTTPEGQKLYLLALGNAGLSYHAEPLAGFAGSTSSDVRWQTASALRKLDDDASRATLLELAVDPVPRVQLRALWSLREREDLTSGDVVTLGENIGQRRIAEVAYPGVVSLLAPRLGSDANVRGIFDTILAQDLEDADIKARIRSILSN